MNYTVISKHNSISKTYVLFHFLLMALILQTSLCSAPSLINNKLGQCSYHKKKLTADEV